MTEHSFIPSRRSFLAATGSVAALAAFIAPRETKAATLSEVEKANEKVVDDFCAAWATLDPDNLGSYLAEDATFRAIESSPRVEGRDAIIDGLRGFLSSAKSARFEMLRSTVIGNTVLNERIDHFDTGDNQLSFHISGFFLVVNGKIKEWQDYTWPEVE